MANVLNRTTNQYLASVNTVEFPIEDWLYNPDVSQVVNETEQIGSEYWIIPVDPPQVGAVITADRVEWQKSKKINSLDSARSDQEDLGFMHDGVVYTPDDRENTDLYSTMAANVRYGTPLHPEYFWRAADGTNTYFTDPTELLQIFTEFNDRKDTIRRMFYDKTDEINALTTEQEVIDYDVNSGWPPL